MTLPLGIRHTISNEFSRASASMKINGNEIRPGNVIEHNKSLWVAVKTQAVKPGKGPAYNQVELKNLINGSKLNERFRSSETVERVRLEQKDFQFLYVQGDTLVLSRAIRLCSWTRTHTSKWSFRRTLWASAPRFFRMA